MARTNKGAPNGASTPSGQKNQEKIEKTPIETVILGDLIGIVEKINDKLDPILGILYGESTINDPKSLLNKLGRLDQTKTAFATLSPILSSIYDILQKKFGAESSSEAKDSATVISTGKQNYDSIINNINENIGDLGELISAKFGDILEDEKKRLVNLESFNIRTAQIIDAINGKTNGKDGKTTALQYDLNIKASGLDADTVGALIDLSKISSESTDYLKNLNNIVESLSNFEKLNDIKLNGKNIKNIINYANKLGSIDLSFLSHFDSKNLKQLKNLDKFFQSLIGSSTSLKALAAISPKEIDITENLKLLNNIASQVNTIKKIKNEKNLKSLEKNLGYLSDINKVLIAFGATKPLAQAGAKALEAEMPILNKVVGQINKGIPPVNKDAQKNLSSFAKILLAASSLLLLGAVLGGYVLKNFANILGFTTTLSLFIVSTIGALNLATKGMKGASTNLENFSELLTRSAIVMLLGGLIVTLYSPIIMGSLTFSLILGAFILSTVGALNLATRGMKDAVKNLFDFEKLLTRSAIVMLLGGLIVTLYSPIIMGSLMFSLILGVFIVSTIGALNLATKGMKAAVKNLLDFEKLITRSAIVMLLGGLIMTLYTPIVLGSLAFSVLLGLFIVSTVGAFNLATKGINSSIHTAEKFAILVAISASALLIGGALFALYPALMATTLLFAVYLTAFVFGITFIFNTVGKEIDKALVAADKFVILVGVSTLSLLLGGFLFMQYPFMMLTTLLFASYLVAFVFGVTFLFNIAAKELDTALIAADKFAILVGLSALSLCLGGFLIQQFPWMTATIPLFAVYLALFIKGIILAYASASKSLKSAEIDAKNFAKIVGISAITLLLGGLVMLIPGLPLAAAEFAVIFGGFMWGILSAYSFASKMVKESKKTAITFGIIVLITSAAMLAGGGILLAYPGLAEACLKFAGLSFLFIVIFGGAIWALSKIEQDVLVKGELALAGIAAIIGLMGYAFTYVGKAIDILSKVQDPLKQLGIMALVITAVAGIAIGLGAIASTGVGLAMIALGEVLLAGIMGIIILMGKAISCIAQSMQDLDKAKNIDFKILTNVITGFVGIMPALLPLANPMIVLKMLLVRRSISAMSTAITEIATAIQYVCDLKTSDGKSLQASDFALAAKNVEAVVTCLGGALIKIYEEHPEMFVDKLIGDNPFVVVSNSCAVMGELISDISAGVKDFAELKMPIYDKNGKVTGYRNMTDADFETAAKAVSKVVTCLGGALIAIYEQRPDMFVYKLIGDNPFVTVSKSCAVMGQLITDISAGVKDFAELKMPIYDKDGKVKGYRNMTEADFETAAKSVEKVITCLGGALINIYEEHPDMFVYKLIGDNPFVTVSKSCAVLGELITDISAGVKDFAELKMPIYDKNGKVTGYRNMTDADFETAAKSVEKVITCLGGALITLYEEHQDMFGWQLLGDNPFASVSKSCSTLGVLITDISAGVKNFAELKMPIYDKNGKITGYRPMTANDFKNAAKAVENVVTCLAGALLKVYEGHEEMFAWQLFGDNPFATVSQSCATLGQLITNISAGVKDFADLKMPIYGDDGKITGYRPMTADDFNNAATAVEKVVTCLAGALSEVYKNHPELFDGDSEDSTFAIVFNSCSTLGQLITSISAGVKDFAELQMPIYGDDGKITGYRPMTADDFSNAATHVKEVITCLSGALIEEYAEHPEMFTAGTEGDVTSGDTPFAKVAVSCSTLGQLITDISTGVQSFANLQMPVYGENGKVVSSRPMGPEDFQKAAESVKAVVTCLAGALIEVYNGNEDLFTAGTLGDLLGSDTPFARIANSCLTLGELITQISAGVQSFANLQMPVYDENGQVKGSRPMTQADFKNAAESVKAVVTCLAGALSTLYDEHGEMFKAGNLEELLSGETKLSKVANACLTLGQLITDISTGVKSFAELRMPVYDENGQITGYREMKPEDFKNAGESVSEVISCLSDALITTYNKRPELFGDPKDENGGPLGTVNKALQGVGTMIKDAAIGIQEVAAIDIDFTPLEGKDGKVAKIVSILAGSILEILKVPEYREAFEDPAWFSNKAENSDFGRVMLCLGKLAPFIKEAAARIDEISKMKFTSDQLSDNGELFKKISNLVSVMPKAIINLMTNETYGGYLTDDSYIKVFDNINTMYGKFSSIVKNTTGAISEILKLNFGSGSADTTIQTMGKLIWGLPAKIIQEFNLNKNFYMSAAIEGILEGFKNYNEIISEVFSAYDETIAYLGKIGVSGEDTSIINTITQNLSTLINKLSNAIKVDSMSLNSDLVKIFGENVSTYCYAINELTSAYSLVPNDLTKYTNVVYAIESVNSKIADIKNVDAFEKEQQVLNKYIVTLNSLDLRKVKSLSTLMQVMNELATKLGALDKFTETLNNKIAVTLSNLARQIKVSGDIINKADTLQKQRHKAIKESIKEIQEIMDQKLIVEVNHNEIGDNGPDKIPFEDWNTTTNEGNSNAKTSESQGNSPWNSFGTNNSSNKNSNNGLNSLHNNSIGGIDYEKLRLTIIQAIEATSGTKIDINNGNS